MNRQSLHFCYTLLLLLFYGSLAVSLQAYQPIQWSPLNPYILKDNDKKGPRGIKILDPKGQLIAKTRYSYNSSGRLIRETYFNAKAQETGHTQYHYQKGLVSEERLFDTSGKLLSLVRFFYDSQKRLQKLRSYDAKQKIRSEQSYRYAQKRLIGGLEITGEKQKNKFQIFYEGDRLSRVFFSARSVGKILEITYNYDKKQKIKERIRRLFLEKKISRCIYHYNEKGQLQGYSYKSKDAKGQWIKDRQVVLLYAKGV